MLISGWRSAVYLYKIKVRRIQSEILKCQLETWLSVETLLLIRMNPSLSIFKPFYSIHILHTTQVSLTNTFHCSQERVHVPLSDSCRAGCDLNFSCRFLQAKLTLSQNLMFIKPHASFKDHMCIMYWTWLWLCFYCTCREWNLNPFPWRRHCLSLVYKSPQLLSFQSCVFFP